MVSLGTSTKHLKVIIINILKTEEGGILNILLGQKYCDNKFR